jgi:hypothetical protein
MMGLDLHDIQKFVAMDVVASGNVECEATLLKRSVNPNVVCCRTVFSLNIVGCVLKGVVGNCVGVAAEFYRGTPHNHTVTAQPGLQVRKRSPVDILNLAGPPYFHSIVSRRGYWLI